MQFNAIPPGKSSRKGLKTAYNVHCRMWRYGVRGDSLNEFTTLETRRYGADMVEVFKIIRSFEGTDEYTFIKKRVGETKRRDFKPFCKRIRLDAGKYAFGN